MSDSKRAPLALRMDVIAESATLRLNALVNELRAQGKPVINLTAGEPDFAVPAPVKQAVADAMAANRSKYTATAGIPELRALIAEKTNRQQPGLEKPWTASDVIVSNGGKQAIFNALFCTVNPGDEVVIVSPYWLSYPEMVKLVGGVPKVVRTTAESGFKMSPAQLEAALTDRTRMVIWNSPSNPTGATYTREEYARLGEVILRSPWRDQIWSLSDEIYDCITFGTGGFASFLGAVPALRERGVTVNGMSKSAAMTGWRIGWSVAPAALTRVIDRLQGQTTSGINALAQWASVAGLKLPEKHFADQLTVYRRRRDLALETMRNSGKITISTPEGAFYFFLGVESALRPGEDSVPFAERLLQEAGVAVVPGVSFGEPGWIRISFATDEKSLQEGCERLVAFIEKGSQA
ncbi:MAG: pyridoxal phosphate-dependent aminotransferase [Bacteriovoracia bacterium]